MDKIIWTLTRERGVDVGTISGSLLGEECPSARATSKRGSRRELATQRREFARRLG